jgi:hypothetical protein
MAATQAAARLDCKSKRSTKSKKQGLHRNPRRQDRGTQVFLRMGSDRRVSRATRLPWYPRAEELTENQTSQAFRDYFRIGGQP